MPTLKQKALGPLIAVLACALPHAAMAKGKAAPKAGAKKVAEKTANDAGLASVDLNHFSALYNRSRSLEESVQRLEKMEDLRRTAQESLERLMKERGSNVELELRYGELIVQRGRDLEQFSLEVGAAGDTKRSNTLRDRAHELLRKGLQLHRTLLARIKNHHPMAPKVYLGMARTEYGLGLKSAAMNDADNGIHILQSPDGSGTLLQLYLTKADAAFDLAKAPIALEAYTKAQKLVTRNSLEESYIEYKLAWVYYNLKDAETALAHLDRLFSTSGDRFALQQEAVQDFALFAADLGKGGLDKRGGFKGIYSYLQSKSDNKAAARALEKMASTLAKNGRRPEGVQALEFLIGEDPLGASSVDYALTIVEWSQSLADKKALTDRYFWLIDQFGPKSSWYAAQSSRAEIQRTSQDKIEESVRKYALELHKESMNEQVEELRRKREDVVAKLYDAHIANFSRPDDIPRAQSARIHFYRAEIHRRREEWKEAGQRYDSYLRLVELVPKDQIDKIDAKLHDEAVWGAVQVWAKAIDKDKTLVPSMLGAADRFLKEKEKDPRAPQVLLDAAKVELKSSNPSVALARLDRLVEKYPKTPQTVEGVEAELDILNKENDWVNLAITARKRMDSLSSWAPASDKAKLHAELYKILSQTEAKACEALASQKDRQLEAALCFESFAKGFEKDEQAPKALLRAADLYDGLKDPTAAVSSLELLVKRYPKSDYAAQGFSRLANVYEKAFEFEKAVGIYETLLEKNPKLPEREKVVERMLTLLSGLGFESKFQHWLNSKDTSEKLRRELLAHRAEQDLAKFRMRESAAGYTGRGPASVEGRDFFAELEQGHKAGRLTLEQELEYRRIRGNMYFADKKLDKADQEWLAGLSNFGTPKIAGLQPGRPRLVFVSPRLRSGRRLFATPML
jgi:tetratricopeptide (TPR) repeat protein